MPKSHLDEKSLLTLYEEFSKEKNLVDAVMRKPEYVTIIRLSNGQSQTSYENSIGMTKNIYKYETGKIKPSEKTARKFLLGFKGISSWEEILERFVKFSSESRGWFAANSSSQKAARARKKGAQSYMKIREPTTQENEISAIIASLNLEFEKDFKLGGVFVDFYIPKLELVVECKRLTTRNRREQMKKVKEAALQGYKVKFNEKNVKLAIVLESPLGLSATERHELCGPYDFACESMRQFGDIINDQDV